MMASDSNLLPLSWQSHDQTTNSIIRLTNAMSLVITEFGCTVIEIWHTAGVDDAVTAADPGKVDSGEIWATDHGPTISVAKEVVDVALSLFSSLASTSISLGLQLQHRPRAWPAPLCRAPGPEVWPAVHATRWLAQPPHSLG